MPAHLIATLHFSGVPAWIDTQQLWGDSAFSSGSLISSCPRLLIAVAPPCPGVVCGFVDPALKE
jgi:hypothetical protein